MPEVMAGPHGMYLIPGDAGRMFSNRDIRTLINAFQGGGGRGGSVFNINMQQTGNPAVDSQLVGTTVSALRRVEERAAGATFFTPSDTKPRRINARCRPGFRSAKRNTQTLSSPWYSSNSGS